MGKRLLTLLALGLPLFVFLALALCGGYALAQAMSDEFSARVFFAALVICLGVAAANLLALVAVLGIRALREVE